MILPKNAEAATVRGLDFTPGCSAAAGGGGQDSVSVKLLWVEVSGECLLRFVCLSLAGACDLTPVSQVVPARLVLPQ